MVQISIETRVHLFISHQKNVWKNIFQQPITSILFLLNNENL